MFTRLLYIFLSVLPALSGCKTAPPGTAPPGIVGDTLRVTAGAPFVVELPSLMGAGYAWRLVTGPKADSVSVYAPPQEPGLPPEPGREGTLERFHFGGLPPGTTNLLFLQARAWETGMARDSARRCVVVE